MDILLMRFDAPLMSFGGVMVDQHGRTDKFPGLSMLTGLLGNAMGYRHQDFDKLQALQSRLEYAARWDVAPELMTDYHTVDLGQPKMCDPGWTTRGKPEHRGGGSAARFGTHQRYRGYWCNGLLTVALSLQDDTEPGIHQLARALQKPVRPLFLGRKSCLPSAPVFRAVVQENNVLDALRNAPVEGREGEVLPDEYSACWPVQYGEELTAKMVNRYEQRDWHNQLHTGSRAQSQGQIRRAGA